jgi:hypothetical protein
VKEIPNFSTLHNHSSKFEVMRFFVFFNVHSLKTLASMLLQNKEHAKTIDSIRRSEMTPTPQPQLPVDR